MDYLRANTGVSDEWPIELKVAEDSIDPINTLLNQFEQTIYATDTTRTRRSYSRKNYYAGASFTGRGSAAACGCAV